MDFEPISPELEEIGSKIVDAAYTLHKKFGPGLLESVYEICFVRELEKRGLRVRRQVPVSIVYDDITFKAAYTMDVLVEEQIVVELKSIEKIEPVHVKQLLTYMKLSNCRLGHLINFGAALIRDGIHRKVL